MNDLRSSALDYSLVQRCLQGDPEAWERLYLNCHPAVCAALRHFLLNPNEELIDELAARTWYRLVRDDCHLLAKYSASNGVPLTTYLATVTRNIARDYLKSARRRKRREADHFVQDHSRRFHAPDLMRVEIDELTAGLSTEERGYLQWSTDEQATTTCFSETPGRDYQLRHRLRVKLKAYYR